jgi:hypothetical protein
MPIFTPNQKTSCTPEEELAIVHRFLNKCLQWAEEKEIPNTLSKLNENMDQPLAARLLQWANYRDFTLHTIRELEDGTLDHWFRSETSPDASADDRI